MSLNIGLDIDQTMYHLDAIDYISTLLNMNYKTEDVKHWVYDKQRVNGFPKHFTDLVFALFDDPNYMGNLDVYDDVQYRLGEWKLDGHKLFVISARRPSVQIETVRMLNRDFGYGFFESIHFVEHKTDAKERLFKDLKLDVWIDDNPKDIDNACYLGINTYAITNEYTKYNHKKVEHCLKVYDHCTAVKNIGEIKL